MNRNFLSLLLFSFSAAVVFSLPGCAFKRISRTKDITYLEANPSRGTTAHKLDIYTPRKAKTPSNVLVFIHGGNWYSGSKNLYGFLGNRMARKDVVTVIIQYPLSPEANYQDMTAAAAAAVSWVQQNIADYGGDTTKIFVSGHSAGGHLAALLALRQDYFDDLHVQNPIKGAILIDAAGLDMHGYLQEEKYAAGHTYLKTFTSTPANWKDATPLYHLHLGMPPLLIYRGENTYPSIIKSTDTFLNALKTYTPDPNYHLLKGKKHIPMITQFLWTWNPRYKEIVQFMDAVK